MAEVITSAKQNKDTGADGIFNENIEALQHLLVRSRNTLLSKSLWKGYTPEKRKLLVIQVLHKMKGGPTTPFAFREVAHASGTFELFKRLRN